MKISAGGKTYDFDMSEISNVDVMELESLLGVTVEDWSSALSKDKPGMKDMTLMVWLARRQCGEVDLAFTDVRFPIASFDVEDPDAETASAPDGADPTPGSPEMPGEPLPESDTPPVGSSI